MLRNTKMSLSHYEKSIRNMDVKVNRKCQESNYLVNSQMINKKVNGWMIKGLAKGFGSMGY